MLPVLEDGIHTVAADAAFVGMVGSVHCQFIRIGMVGIDSVVVSGYPQNAFMVPYQAGGVQSSAVYIGVFKERLAFTGFGVEYSNPVVGSQQQFALMGEDALNAVG